MLIRCGNGAGWVQSFLIPYSVQFIGKNSIGSPSPSDSCRGLEFVVFERGTQLLDIRQSAFAFCSALKYFHVPASIHRIPDTCFDGCTMLSHLGFEFNSRVTTIDDWAFDSCSSLKSLIIPAGVSDIGRGAFRLTNVTHVVVEEGNASLKIVGECVFDSNGVRLIFSFGSSPQSVLSPDAEILSGGFLCHFCNIREVKFERGSKLCRIRDYAFAYAFSLRSVVIPASVTTIHGTAFRGCDLETISVEDGSVHFRAIGKFLLDFAGKSVVRYFGSESSVSVLRQVEVLCVYSFACCPKLAKLDFEEGSLLREIEPWAFSDCPSLATVAVPESATKVPGSAFVQTGVTSIVVSPRSKHFRTSGNFLLDSQRGLVRYFGAESTVTIPRFIVALRGHCFQKCEKLRTLSFEPGSALVEIDQAAFMDCHNLTLNGIPASVVSIHGLAFCLTIFAHISVAAEHPGLRCVDDFLMDVNQSKLIRYFGSSSALVVSRWVEEIGDYCFAHNRDLLSLTFESGSKLRRIGVGAFFSCDALRAIVIPASVTAISGGAFAGCGIVTVSIEEGNNHFCISGEYLLDIAKTSLIAFLGHTATVTVGTEIQIICERCFTCCRTISRVNFESVSQLRRIERLAFGECSALHTICVPASIEALERDWYAEFAYCGMSLFDTVQFASAESLAKMVREDRADLNGSFDIEVANWTGDVHIPGYRVDCVIAPNVVRLKRSSQPADS
jgi:hypothetical protein